jgi:ubiquinone biosynthesis UbiH/UbiF/VisC/COQ6 family hydroxylase
LGTRIVVVGGGPVGLAFAIGAARLPGVMVTVIERGAAAPTTVPTSLQESFDHRVYALSPASLTLLAELGAHLPEARMAPVRAMQVWGDDGKSELDFASGQPLATIVEHVAVMRALEAAAAQDGRVEILRGVSPESMKKNDDSTHELKLSNGQSITADLLIAADGAKSQIRHWAGLDGRVEDYESDGVVANFNTSIHHGDTARQWFTMGSVLAYLPLPGNQISIVWSVANSTSKALLSEDPAVFTQKVKFAAASALGELTLVSPIARFPLVRLHVKAWVQPGLALMGDAAHALHPLAGQGVNLGFADAGTMCRLLKDRSRFSSVGDLAVLRDYERARKEGAWAVGELTGGLRSLFMADGKALRKIRNGGMAMLNRMPAAKALLVDYAST